MISATRRRPDVKVTMMGSTCAPSGFLDAFNMYSSAIEDTKVINCQPK
jgi:hypothetical protein